MKTPMPPWFVVHPHMNSVSPAWSSLCKELHRMESLGWRKFWPGWAHIPGYAMDRGGIPRKWEPHRWRNVVNASDPPPGKQIYTVPSKYPLESFNAHNREEYSGELASIISMAEQIRAEQTDLELNNKDGTHLGISAASPTCL